MSLKIETTTKFKKDLKLARKRGLDLNHLKVIIDTLCSQEQLNPRYRDHELHGNYEGYRECHIAPDWLLVYAVNNQKLVLVLARTGTHSDLF